MRFLTLFLSVLLLTSSLFSQKRFLVSPNQEVIPVTKYSSPSEEISKRIVKGTSSVTGNCSGTFIFGYEPSVYVTTSNFGMYHKDVLGQWYVAKAAGTIDTVYWEMFGLIGTPDSTVNLRIHRSKIGPGSGPGFGAFASQPPCQSWGYWKTTNDYDMGIAPFLTFLSPTEDTTWYSTIASGTSFPPFDSSMYGQKSGQPITVRPYEIIKADLAGSGVAPTVSKGDVFFISFQPSGPNAHVSPDIRTEFAAWGSDGPISTTNENWPARNWKFYEHDSGPSNCAGVPTHLVKRGWVARGPFDEDPFYTAAYNVWYSMTATTNVPPIIKAQEGGDPTNTFSNQSQVLSYIIYDCDPEFIDSAAVSYVKIKWSKANTIAGVEEFVDQPDIYMTHLGSDFYSAEIPGQPPGTTISYQVEAADVRGMVNLGASNGYKIVTLNNPYYRVDTGYTCTMQNISQTGTSITYDKFFINSAMSGAGEAPRDDGTAGPFDIGGDIHLFAGDTARYAWVSVNGAIALSENALDTIDVNANGFATTGWDFPMLQHHYRADTMFPSRMPPNFIAPFWADMIIADTFPTPTVYGKIVYGNGGDNCQFIVEWDSIGTFDRDGSTSDVTTFRVILNHCDGSIEYQYNSVGTLGLDSLALVGLQADSTDLTTGGGTVDPGFVFINRNTYPYETKPRNNWCIKMYAGAPIYVTSGWKMLSVSTQGPGSMSKSTLYPNAISAAFRYSSTSGYQITDPLVNGAGYWLKYDKYSYAGGPGIANNNVTIPVTAGWNLIGSIAKPIAVASIEKSPADLTIGTVYQYTYKYENVSTITPGWGYWVKTNMAGTLTLTGSATLPKQEVADYSQINKVTIIDKAGRYQTLYIGEEGLVQAAGLDAGEWPPAAPDFDARFKNSKGMVATYPSKLEAAKYDYPISIATDAYPVVIKWEVSKAAEKALTLVSGGKLLTVLEGSGSMKVKDGAGLGLALNGNVNVPKVFALGQN
ncbi:MAG: hypothetical protein C0417_07810, partial [Chlorobiaceae bacterium]|nr:hypothetical protein [Chlorobiaceae bacterium]